MFPFVWCLTTPTWSTRIRHHLQAFQSDLFSQRSNFWSNLLACGPYFDLDACNSIEAKAYFPVMITEMLSSACVVLLVVVICCMIKLYNMVKVIRPSGDESVGLARENHRALLVEREPTVSFPRAHESVGQRGTCNSTTYGGLQAIRRQPQMHDERFRRQRKKNLLCLIQNLKVKFFFFLRFLELFCVSSSFLAFHGNRKFPSGRGWEPK